MGTVKGGQRWTGAAVQGQAVAGLARAGQVFHRGAGDEPTPTGEIWYLDFWNGRLTQTRPSRRDFGFPNQGNFELFCFWDWSTIAEGFYQPNTLNTFVIGQEYAHRISDGIALMISGYAWIDINEAWEFPILSSEVVTLNIDTRSGAPQNGDFWLEVTNA